jgi:hypothetical protein
MLCYIFALLHSALTLLRSIITFIIYHSGHTGAVIASYIYFPRLIDQRYSFYALSLFRCYIPLFTSLFPLSK